MVAPVAAGTWVGADIQAYDVDLFTDEVERRSLPSPDGLVAPGVSWVRFGNGARINWHVHRGGQILYILEGQGCVVTEGTGVIRVGAGDLVRSPAGVRH